MILIKRKLSLDRVEENLNQQMIISQQMIPLNNKCYNQFSSRKSEDSDFFRETKYFCSNIESLLQYRQSVQKCFQNFFHGSFFVFLDAQYKRALKKNIDTNVCNQVFILHSLNRFLNHFFNFGIFDFFSNMYINKFEQKELNAYRLFRYFEYFRRIFSSLCSLSSLFE